MENNIEFWKRQSMSYKWLYEEQKEIADAFRKIIEELQQELKDIKLKK